MAFGKQPAIRGGTVTIPARGRGKATDTLSGLVAETDEINLQRIGEAGGVTRSADLGRTYVEDEYDTQADEQQALWAATGEADSREATITGSSEDHAANAAVAVSDGRKKTAKKAKKEFDHASSTLTPFVRRSPRDGVRYWTVYSGLGLGDVVGIWGASILMGEIPLLALGQAVSTGLAAVTAGAVGGEVRSYGQATARQRDFEGLTEDEKKYRRLFEGARRERSVLVIASLIAFLIVVLIAGAIFALRASTEGTLAGIVFGALAGATAMGSFINSYLHADEVADLIHTYEVRYEKAVGHLDKASQAEVIKERAAAKAESRSIKDEDQLRGLAAGYKVMSLKNRVLRRNPQIVGHAYEARPTAHLTSLRGGKRDAA